MCLCRFWKQSDNNKITRAKSIQIVNVQVGCEHSSIVLIRAVFVNFTTTLDKRKKIISWRQKIRLVLNENFCFADCYDNFWESSAEWKISTLGTVPYPIVLYGKQRP